ncbi:MAG: hypothetical protein WBM15_07070, partial [Chromatiaceae bacterium]
AQTLLDYAPTQRISEGLALAMPWYVGQRPAPNMSLEPIAKLRGAGIFVLQGQQKSGRRGGIASERLVK